MTEIETAGTETDLPEIEIAFPGIEIGYQGTGTVIETGTRDVIEPEIVHLVIVIALVETEIGLPATDPPVTEGCLRKIGIVRPESEDDHAIRIVVVIDHQGIEIDRPEIEMETGIGTATETGNGTGLDATRGAMIATTETEEVVGTEGTRTAKTAGPIPVARRATPGL